MVQAEQILAKKGVRITAMRLLILSYFLEEQKVFGLSELTAAFPRSDRITIYRTLKTFEENGILHGIEQGIAELKYALCPEHCSPESHQDLHPHFQCTTCQQIICLESITVRSPALPIDYTASEVSMTIKGLCASCRTSSLQ